MQTRLLTRMSRTSTEWIIRAQFGVFEQRFLQRVRSSFKTTAVSSRDACRGFAGGGYVVV